MIEIKAPDSYFPSGNVPSIFLAGSIDMGRAINWQERVTDSLREYDVEIFNPRRNDWDSSWVQTVDNPQFQEQVRWELDRLDSCDIVVYYFDPSGEAPITLLELGLLAWCDPSNAIVCCPEGYWRKGNVDMVCQYSNIKQANDLEDLILMIKEKLDGISK